MRSPGLASHQYSPSGDVTVDLPPAEPRLTSALTVILGFGVAIAVIVSRQPEVVTHPQLWAEDGRVYFQDVYNLGIKRTLVLPQAGYYQTVPVLAAWLARFFSLKEVPFVMRLVALLVQALPVPLLLSHRAETISGDIRVRGLFALAYLVIPNSAELDSTTVNTQWFLAVSALIIILWAPPRRPRWRFVDGVVLLAAGLTGPFAVVLAILAWIRRRLRGSAFVPTWEAVLLTVCGVLQVLSLAVISPHDAGQPGVEVRPSPVLGATPDLFARLVGGRLVLGTILGETHGLEAPLALQWAALVAAVLLALVVLASRREELIFPAILGGGALVGGLLAPSAGSPAWPALAAVPANSQRYYILAELAFVAILIWGAARRGPLVPRVIAGAAALSALAFAIAGQWMYPSLPSTGFSRQAAVFAHAARGTSVTFPENPPHWSMTLIKR